MTRPEIELAVEAALLNSQGDPIIEARAALHVVVRFAMIECGVSGKGLHEMLEAMIRTVEKEEGL